MAESKEIVVYQPPDLNSRLKEEHELLEKYFWPEKFPILYTVNNEPYFERIVKLKDDRNYKLRVSVRSDYPASLPDLVVCESPEPMPDGPDWSASHDTHTWPRKDGFLHICHWHPICWKRENMIFQVFNKGEEWLEAYEKYLVTKTLPLELDQMELTEEEKEIELQQRSVQLHQWHLYAITSNILSRQLPITVRELVRDARMLGSEIQRVNQDPIWLAQMLSLQCSITEHSLANPGSLINNNFTLTNPAGSTVHVSEAIMNGKIIGINVTPLGPRSTQNN